MTRFRSAQIEDFNARLLAADSVSAFLGTWCGEPVRAIKDEGAAAPLSEDQRKRLQAAPGEATGYRSVRLLCGNLVLSHAEVWYREALLTPAMRRSLQETDSPFGIVVSPLGQRRETYAVAELDAPFILEHRALLVTGDGVPFGIVCERYVEEALAKYDGDLKCRYPSRPA